MSEGARGAAAEGARLPRRGRRRSPLRRGLDAILALLARSGLSAGTSGTSGLLGTLDARAGILGVAALVVATSLVAAPWALGALFAVALSLMLTSRVPLRRYAPILLAAPLFSLVAVLPASLAIVTPGRPLLSLWPAHGIVVTDTGALVAGRLVLRTLVSVLLVVSLGAALGTTRLYRGLRGLGVPHLFVRVLAMMERYLSVLGRAAADIHLAALSRGGGAAGSGRAFAAAGTGALYRRARSLGEGVHLAMRSRGFTGEPPPVPAAPLRALDVVFAASALAGAAVLVVLAR